MWVLYPRSSVVSVVLVGFLQLFNQLVNRWYPELGSLKKVILGIRPYVCHRNWDPPVTWDYR